MQLLHYKIGFFDRDTLSYLLVNTLFTSLNVISSCTKVSSGLNPIIITRPILALRRGILKGHIHVKEFIQKTMRKSDLPPNLFCF